MPNEAFTADLEKVYNENRSQREIRSAREIRLEDLIHWFSLKYGDNNPEFPEFDPSTQTVLAKNIELSRTWYEVVRGGVRCEACRGARYFKVKTDDPDIDYLRTCEDCEGQGFTEISG